MWSLHIWPYLLVLVAVRGKLLNYDRAESKLHFKCPPEDVNENGEIFGVFLKRMENNVPTELASWSRMSGVLVKDTKMVTSNPMHPPDKLGATLNKVDCDDTGIYNCTVKQQISVLRTTILKSFTDTFTYKVEEDPEVYVNPLKSCYNTGDKITLNCAVDTGTGTDANTIVWEAKSPAGDFSLITGNDRQVSKEEKRAEKDKCSVRRYFSMTFMLEEEDHGSTFQCRLNESIHSKQLTLPSKCAMSSTSPASTRVLGGMDSDTTLATSKADAVREQAQSLEDTNNTAVSVSVPLCVIVMVLGVFFLVWYRRRKKRSEFKDDRRQAANLRTSLTQGYPSFSGSSVYGDRYVSRALPELPASFPSLFTYLDSQGHVIIPPNPPADVDPPRNTPEAGVSDYVTMTSTLSSTARASGASDGGKEEAEPKTEEEGLMDTEEEGPVEDEDEAGEPRMRTIRLYSNSEEVRNEICGVMNRTHTQSGTDDATYAKSVYK